ncbi:unnamed protein product [Coregonus sp. 'balchen']|nr:unnamed protein product [Coregonus sp. 'balchen']
MKEEEKKEKEKKRRREEKKNTKKKGLIDEGKEKTNKEKGKDAKKVEEKGRREERREKRRKEKPIHSPRRLEVVDVQSKQVTIRWEPFGYNVTRCHSYNLTVQYRSRVAGKNETREEVCYDTLGRDPQHTIHNLTPYTNLSVKLVLKNPEGSIQGSAYEEKMILKWREPAQTYGIITQYEISFKAVSSFDPELDLSNQSGKVLKHANETSHIFLGLYPGSTYSFTLRASTAKGYGPPVITQFTTKISGQSQAPSHHIL